ncbi:uncharacterized protein TNCV_2245291 [Trichonephila clavipes]|nr:uncharacterized protein TNCV_2245291 [Trichonephila clavipes]
MFTNNVSRRSSRELGTHYHPSNIKESDQFGRCRILVRGGIMLDGRIPLHILMQVLLLHSNIKMKFLNFMRLFRGAIGQDFIFMDDNARPQRANPVEDFLEEEVYKLIKLIIKLKLSGATAHEGQGLLCSSQYTRPMGTEMHEQMSQSGDQSEARPPVFKSPSKLGTLLATHCSRDERLNLPCPA